MLQNFFLVAVIITIAWMLLIGVYLLLAARQRELEQELEELQQRLERDTGGIDG